MKFGEQLDAHIFPEWSQYYVRYRAIKDHTEQLFPLTSDKQKRHPVQHKLNELKHSVSRQLDALINPVSGEKVALLDDEHKSGEQYGSTQLNIPHQHSNSDIIGAANASSDHERSIVTTSEGADAFSSPSDTDAATDTEHTSQYSGKYRLRRNSAAGTVPTDIDRRIDEVLVKVMYELNKVNQFYTVMEDELLLAFNALKLQVEHIIHPIQIRTTPKRHRSKQVKQFAQKTTNHTAPHSSSSTSTNNHKSSGSSDVDEDVDNSENRQPSHTVKHRHTEHTHLMRVRSDDETSAHQHSADEVKVDILEDRHNYLRSQFIELLRKQTMLVHYVDINLLAFRKVLKNLEKRSYAVGVQKHYMAIIKSKYFATSDKIDPALIQQTYQLFADVYEAGNIETAKIVLLNKMTEVKYTKNYILLLGIKIGIFFMLLFLLLLILSHPIPHKNLHYLVNFSSVYRSIGFLIITAWLWSACVYIFDTYRISYVFVFQLNPRTRLTHIQLINECINISIFYTVNLLLFIQHFDHQIHRYVSSLVYPLILLLYIVVKLLFPWSNYWTTRRYLLNSLRNIGIAPFGKVKFGDIFIADVLTSMIKIFVDLYISVLYYVTGDFLSYSKHNAQRLQHTSYSSIIIPLICCAPLYFRFMQCIKRYIDTGNRWPHVANAVKYALAHTVVIVSAFHPNFTKLSTQNNLFAYQVLWLICYVVTTLYTFYWDVTQDWGLLSRNKTNGVWSHTYWLRDKLLYHTPYVYYAAIVANFVLRFGWCILLVPFSSEGSLFNTASTNQNFLYYLLQTNYIILPVLILIELFRRFLWAVFRVEYEQLAHGIGFRLNEFIPIFFQHNTNAEQQSGDTQQKTPLNITIEVAFMTVLLLTLAVAGATL